MAEELSSLILKLSTYQPIGSEPRPKALNFIQNYPRFISTLIKINEMIGLENVKQQIANQVKSFVVNYRRCSKPTNGEKLHTLLYGPPGCGKTQLGKYLAELWAASGCLPPPKSKNSPISDLPALLSATINRTNLNSSIDPEKTSLKHNLAIREAQIKQYQEKIRNLESNAQETLTLYNNVRKKVRSRIPEQEAQIQAKFQEIKRRLREISGQALHPPVPPGPSHPQILTVTVPQGSGARSIFGQNQPPLLPILPVDPSLGNLPKLPAAVLKPDQPKSSVKIELSEASDESSVKFGVLTRGDLIGKFQGHTTDKVKQIFEQYDGGVIFVDEAYSLCTSEQDDFGKEILTEINNYMSAHPDRIIFIFAGYRDEMENAVLKAQPGLARRFNWTFEIDGYTSQELSRIFQHQLSREEWKISTDQIKSVETFFEKNTDKFPHYGGDTERLCAFIKETCYEQHWILALDEEISDSDYQDLFESIDLNMIEKSFQKYLTNSVAHRSETSKQKDLQDFMNRSNMYV